VHRRRPGDPDDVLLLDQPAVDHLQWRSMAHGSLPHPMHVDGSDEGIGRRELAAHDPP
jgi:hypothetical protein